MQIQQTNNGVIQRFLMALVVMSMLTSGVVIASESLEQRVQRYWAARASNDIQTVYSLESAALPGGWLTPDQHRSLGGLPVRDVKILETRIEGDRAEVKIQGQVGVGSLGWMPQTLGSTWVLINGEWYHQTPNP